MGFKGGVLKDDAVLAKLGVKKGQTVMLVGSAAPSVECPTELKNIVFEEDVLARQGAAAAAAAAAGEGGAGYHVGLVNLGNTCYLNATVQCLRQARELEAALADGTPAGPHADFAAALGHVVAQLRAGAAVVTPVELVAALRQLNPRFAERSACACAGGACAGAYKQQDAEECWTAVLAALADCVQLPPALGGGPAVERLFEGVLETTSRCAEAPAEPATVRTVPFRKLCCHIDASVMFLAEGLRKGLLDTVEKHSPSLGRNSTYEQRSAISRLPAYLTVQFVRFSFTKIVCKIVRPVQFPMVLDVADLCTDELRAALTRVRAADRVIEDLNAGITPCEPADADAPADADPLANQNGLYDLVGIVSHQGMYADGGHYVCWAKESTDRWIKFDDDKVSVVDSAQITKLDGRGGGDWHIAYLLLYRSKPRPVRKAQSDAEEMKP